MVFALWAEDIAEYGIPSRERTLRGMDIFSDLVAGVFSDRTEEYIGRVSEVFKDRNGQIEYVIVAIAPAHLKRNVLLPGDRVYVDHKANRVYAAGLSKAQVEQFPPYTRS